MPKGTGGAGGNLPRDGSDGAGHISHGDTQAAGRGAEHYRAGTAPGGSLPAAHPAVSDAFRRRRENHLKRLKATLSPKRLAHSLSVEHVSVEFALSHQLDADLAAEAGLLHDNARDTPLEEMRAIAREALPALDEGLLASAALLHAPVGELMAEREYGVKDEAVLSAIRWHTTGRERMSPLEQAVYLADMVEPGRGSFPGRDEIAMLAREDLDEAMLLALSQSVEYIRQKGQPLHPDTQRAFLYYLQKTGGTR